MRLLHTSDWHLGRMLYGRRRDQEFEEFLKWMAGLVRQRQADVLVIAGDIFDTTTPGNRAQAMYYEFLHQLISSGCRHVVIVAGNHDSPTFLNAPSELLSALGVHVVGQVNDDISRQVIVLRSLDGEPQMVVCAVPFLRDKDVRLAAAEETAQDKEHKLLQGIREHYSRVAQEVRRILKGFPVRVPVIATGHLFAAGAITVQGDGVRDLYVGSLGQVGADVFDPVFDYVALGHLHVPQKVAGLEHIRYSGSPLPMGFGEAPQRKVVCEVDFGCEKNDGSLSVAVNELAIPQFQRLAQTRGDFEQISRALKQLLAEGGSCWVEVTYESDLVMPDLRQKLEQLVADSGVEILRIKVARQNPSLRAGQSQQLLQELSPQEVFEQCLQAHSVDHSQRPGLKQTFLEVLQRLDQERP